MIESTLNDLDRRIKGKDGSKDKSKLDDLLSLNNDKRYELSEIEIILSILAFINLSLIYILDVKLIVCFTSFLFVLYLIYTIFAFEIFVLPKNLL